jgi:hypothetical protein
LGSCKEKIESAFVLYYVVIIDTSSSLFTTQFLSTGLPYGLHIRRTWHNLLHEPSADWRMLSTAKAAGTNGIEGILKHEGVQDNRFLAIHKIIDFCKFA